MRVVIFTHSLVSDWNHGNAHFLRGIAQELLARGCEVRIFEPRDGWSRQNLIREYGEAAIFAFERRFPELRSSLYDLADFNPDQALQGANLVLVHEWNDPELVARISEHRHTRGSYRLLFHDTHHRSVTDPNSIGAYDLRYYDGILAYGNVVRDLYRSRFGIANAWTWHEAADVRTFYPQTASRKAGDLVWIGNWGDEERAEEIREFLIGPVRRLKLKATVYGVRYPAYALGELADAGIEYRGWLPNYRVPSVFAQYSATIHIPRRPYATALPGIPTIRPFEALACGIPLISAPWRDSEHLFRTGDFFFVQDGAEVDRCLNLVLSNDFIARRMSRQGLDTIRERHTCAHRVDELLAIAHSLAPASFAERIA